MRTVVAIVAFVAFAIGAAVGVAAVYGKLDEARTERDALASECGRLRTEVSRLEQARVDARNRADQATARTDAPGGRAEEAAAMTEATQEPTGSPDDVLMAANGGPEGTGQGRRDEDERDSGLGEGRTVPLGQAVRRAEMRERMAGMREQAFLTLDDAIVKSTDPAEQERLTALAETTATMMDLFGEMREAQTDEERDAVRAAIGETMESQRALVDEQRDYKTREILEDYGIASDQKQDEFMSALDGLRNDPVLSSPMLGGWGRGPGRGGRGRGPGR